MFYYSKNKVCALIYFACNSCYHGYIYLPSASRKLCGFGLGCSLDTRDEGPHVMSLPMTVISSPTSGAVSPPGVCSILLVFIS